MKKLIVFSCAILVFGLSAQAQRYFTRDAAVQFASDTPVEKIEAQNKSGTAVLDSKSGRIECKVLIKNFIFEKALMQEHFNENYMESTKYPSATFKGTLTNLSAVNFNKAGTYAVKAKGKMKIHGVEKAIEVAGTITVSDGGLQLDANFILAPADFNISIPNVVRDNIAKEIAVTINASLQAMGK
jgi:polyisoprenoid-binding protein YceI